MMQRFASASAVASVLIALAAGGLRLIPVPTLHRRIARWRKESHGARPWHSTVPVIPGLPGEEVAA